MYRLSVAEAMTEFSSVLELVLETFQFESNVLAFIDVEIAC